MNKDKMSVRVGQTGTTLTSAHWLDVLGQVTSGIRATPAREIELDLSEVYWIGHLPLLGLCMGVEEIHNAHFDRCSIRMPQNDPTRAFLQRWAFYKLAETKKFSWDQSVENPYRQAKNTSCVLPIRRFAKLEDAKEVRDELRHTDTEVYNLLKTAAFLDEEDIRGLADLIVFELCKNAIEHGRTPADSFIFGRVSKSDERVRPAPWEAAFFKAIRGEGMTEIVLGDAGVGIISSLTAKAKRHKKYAANDILEWAFAPFSTRKAQNEDHTRGLWAVRNKVRELRGVLYVRTSVDEPGRTGGVSASWDFFNEPSKDEPDIHRDQTRFRGTQIQILLPHRSPERPYTFISWSRAAAASARRVFRPRGLQIPVVPPANGKLDIRSHIEGMGPDDVLFIDMSRMDENAWHRTEVDALQREITFRNLSDDLYAALDSRFRRVWLMNPKPRTVEWLRASSWVTTLWQQHGILQPAVTIDGKDRSKPPGVQFIASDTAARSSGEGDTWQSRKALVRLIRKVISEEPDPINIRSFLKEENLSPEERDWVTTHLAMNSAIVDAGLDEDGGPRPALDIETLASATIEALLPDTLRNEVEERIRQQNATPDRAWYQLPSGRFCRNYIDPHILTELDAPARNAMDKWIEQHVAASHAEYAISYTSFANQLLTRAARGHAGLKGLIPLKHYLGTYEELDDAIPPSSHVVLLVAISGSGSTIERILQHLQSRNCTATVICLIDTGTAEQRAKLPLLARLDGKEGVHYLLRKGIPVYEHHEIAKGPDAGLPIATIDPDTLVPIAPVRSFSSLITDGEYWWLLGASEGLGNEPVEYKGHHYTTFPWMRNIFKPLPEKVRQQQEAKQGEPLKDAVDLVLEHMKTCFGREMTPDIICVNAETNAALRGTGATSRTRDFFKQQAKILPENDPAFDAETQNLQAKFVIIFAAAANSGTGIARLLKRFETARRIHICVFISRIPEATIASFTRQPKVTFNAFRRIFSGSSETSTGTSRSIRLKNLADYRPSCISNRLLLFVEEQEHAAARHLVAQEPDDLELITRTLPRPDIELFRRGETYDFSSVTSRKHLQALVRRCNDYDAPWLTAVLDEIASREASRDLDRRNASPTLPQDQRPAHTTGDRYVENVYELYRSAPNLPGMTVKTAIMTSLILDRWHGREEITPHGGHGFGVTLLNELQHEQAPPAFYAACIRTISKVDRNLLIDNLSDFIEVARRSRDVELTLSLELTKILDDEKTAEPLLARLNEIVLERSALRFSDEDETASDVALDSLLNDLGLHIDDSGNVAFLHYEAVFSILRSEPPSAARTIRALIRAARGLLGPRAHFLYYREMSRDRFVYFDAWPRKEANEPQTVRQRNVRAARLLDGNQPDYFSEDVSTDPAARHAYYDGLGPNDKIHLKNRALGVYRLGENGFFRVFYDVSGDHVIPMDSFRELQKAIEAAGELLERPESSLTRIGTFQYRETVEKFQSQGGQPGDVNPLREYAERVRSLLGADVGSLVVFDSERDMWTRDTILGRPTPDGIVEFGRNEEDRVTNAVAESRTHLKFHDSRHREAEGFPHPGIARWVEGWLSMPLPQHDECRVVVHLWHHIPGWFDAYGDDLIEALSKLGGGIAEIQAAYDRARNAQRFTFDRIEVDNISSKLRNLTLIAEGLAMTAREDGSTESLDDLAMRVRDIHSHVEALLQVFNEVDVVPASVELPAIVNAAVATAKELYGDQKFVLTMPDDLSGTILEPRMLSRTLAELLKNAKAHLRPEGQVHIDVRFRDAHSAAAISIEVKNPGWGVRPEEKLRIFENGVGLRLAKVTARRHGGHIVEDGEFGENALFRLTIPIQRLETN